MSLLFLEKVLRNFAKKTLLRGVKGILKIF